MPSLNQAITDLEVNFATMITNLGTDFTLVHTDDTTETIKMHQIPAGRNDEPIVNALGVDAVFLHCLPTPLPTKLERLIAPSTREYTIEAVHEVYVKNTLVGFKVIAR